MVFDPRKLLGDDYAWNFPGVAREAESLFGGEVSRNGVDPDVATETGVLGLDLALGGGLPTGIAEIYGKESSGKTALVGSILARSQQLGYPVALCGGEHYDDTYFQRLGVDTSGLVLIRGDMEPVLRAALSFLRNGGVVAVDSVTAFRPLENSDSGYWNELLFDFLRYASSAIPTGSVLVLASQVRVRRSIAPGRLFGMGVESASRWVADMFSTQMELSRTEVGDFRYTMLVKLVKNLNGLPDTTVELPSIKGYGIDKGLDTLQMGVHWGVVVQHGSFYLIDGEPLGQGALQASTNIVGELRNEIMRRVKKAAKSD